MRRVSRIDETCARGSLCASRMVRAAGQPQRAPPIETHATLFRAPAEFSFETNAAPVGGYVNSNLRQITAGQDEVLLQTMAWVDDVDDLPLTYEFGYAHGWHKVASVSRCGERNFCTLTFNGITFSAERRFVFSFLSASKSTPGVTRCSQY